MRDTRRPTYTSITDFTLQTRTNKQTATDFSALLFLLVCYGFTNELTASAARRFKQFRGRKSNVARVNQTKTKLFIPFFHQSCVCHRNWHLNDGIDGRLATSEPKMRQTFFWFLLLFVLPLCCAVHRMLSYVWQVFSISDFYYYYFSPSFTFSVEQKRETRDRRGKKLYDGEPHTMETKIDLLKEFVWTRRTTNMKWKLRGCASRKPKIEFSDVISLNEEKRRKAITALSRRERRRANIANILFSGRCITMCQ